MNTCTYMYLLVLIGKECVHKESAESSGLVADEVIVFFFTLHPSLLSVGCYHRLLIVECYSVRLMFYFPFFLLMPITLDCGQTQRVS